MKSILKILVFGLMIALLPSCITSYYISRHAEKECEDCDTCGLTRNGFGNANALRDTLIKRGIDTIFTSQCLRTKLTAMPLAKALGKKITTYPQNINTFIADLNSFNSNKSILVVSHSPEIPLIVKALANVDLSPEDLDYGHLFIIKKIRFLKTCTTFQKTHYGNP